MASIRPVAKKGVKPLLFIATSLSFILMFGWQFTLLLMAITVIHEAGHLLAARVLKVPVKGLFFVPMIGAAVILDENATQNTRNALLLRFSGSALGGLSAFGAALVYWATNEPWMGVGALLGAAINLLGLFPLPGFDGSLIVETAVAHFSKRLNHAVAVIAWLVLFGVLCTGGWKLLNEYDNPGLLVAISVSLIMSLLPLPSIIRAIRNEEPELPISRRGATYALASYGVLSGGLCALMIFLTRIPELSLLLWEVLGINAY